MLGRFALRQQLFPLLAAGLFLMAPAVASQPDPDPAKTSFPVVVRQIEQRMGAKFIGVQDDLGDVLRLRFIRNDGNVFNVDVDPYTMTPIRPGPRWRRNY
jgi:hypothetical protein